MIFDAGSQRNNDKHYKRQDKMDAPLAALVGDELFGEEREPDRQHHHEDKDRTEDEKADEVVPASGGQMNGEAAHTGFPDGAVSNTRKQQQSQIDPQRFPCCQRGWLFARSNQGRSQRQFLDDDDRHENGAVDGEADGQRGMDAQYDADDHVKNPDQKYDRW